jgi:chromosome segregation ATPase
VSASDTIATLQKELANEQLAQKEANRDVETCTKAFVELREMVDRLLAPVTPFEAQIGILSGTIVDQSTDLLAIELSLQRTTTTKDNLLHQNSQLTKKLESM